MAPKPAEARLPMFFNVDSSVGQGGQNISFDDIMLVQFFLFAIGKKPETQQHLAPLAAVPVTGRMNQQTIDGIKLMQSSAGATADGRVSVARGYRFSSVAFTIVQLNFNVKFRHFPQWPNVEEIPDCPSQLALACRRAMVGDLK